jgi:tellurite resistance protein TerC
MTLSLALLDGSFQGKPVWLWLVFLGVVVGLLALDLGVLHRKQRAIGVAESLWLSAGYIAVALAFGTWLWWQQGGEAGMAYLTGFTLEKTLALDNVFVISIIFASFAIPREVQHRVLVWGILGVIVLRGVLIGVGTALVAEAAWLLLLFGAFLVFTGVKMLTTGSHSETANPAENVLVRLIRRILPVTDRLHGSRFLVRLPDPARPDRRRLWATPLLLALVAVEFVDLVFAVDSIPAILAITTDPFIVYTSNIFAILGLRALYFALAALVHRFAYLKTALALLLVLIGAKIFWSHMFGKVDAAISLTATLVLLGGGILASLLKSRHATAAPAGLDAGTASEPARSAEL